MKFNIFYTLKFLLKNLVLTTLTVLCIASSGLILLASTNISDYASELQYQAIKNMYSDYNVSLTIDHQTDATFASVLGITNLEDYYDDYISGFKSMANISSDELNFDVDLLASDTTTLNKYTKKDYNKFGYGDIVISSYLAKQLNVSLYDKVEITHYGYTMDLYVSEIVDNDSIFSSTSELSTVVIEHYTMAKIFPIYNKYLFNFALFKTDNLELIDKLEDAYPTFNTKDVSIDALFTDDSSVVSQTVIAITIPSLILCILISYTIFKYFEDYNNNELLKLKKIGLDESNAKKIKVLQNLFLSLFSLIIILFGTIIFIPLVNNLYNISFQLDIIDYINVSLYIFLVPLIIHLCLYCNKRNLITPIKTFITTVVLVAIYCLGLLIDSKLLLTINLIIAYILIFTIPKLIYSLIKYLFSKKQSLISLLTKIEKCSILSLLTVSILLTFSMSFFINISISNHIVLSKENDVTVITNTLNVDYKELFNEYDTTYIYEKSDVLVNDTLIAKLICFDDLDTIKLFDIDVGDTNSFNNNEIIISSYYRDILNYNINDTLTVEVNHIEKELTIAGFINEGAYYSSLIFIPYETITQFSVSNYNKIIIHNSDLTTVKTILDNNNVYARVYYGISSSSEILYANLSLSNVLATAIISLIIIEMLFVLILRYRDIEKELNILKMVGCSNKKIIINDLIIFVIKLIVSLLVSILLVYLLKDVFYQFYLSNDFYLYLKLSSDANIFTNTLLISTTLSAVVFTTIYFRRNKVK